MVAAVRVHKHGGPEVLTYEDVDIPAPGQGQIKIKQHAAGINFIDCYFRMGMYPSPVGMPFIAGNESAGEVSAVGPGVTDFKIGDRVAYVGPLGGYAAERVVPADRAVKLPDNISYEQAAGMMLKGMTVQYLVNRTYKVGKGTVCLIHAAAGGVGLIACQWANHLGATVIGTVGSKDKAEIARKNGAHHVILYRDEDFVAKVKEITSGKLCDVVYDGVGKAFDLTQFHQQLIGHGSIAVRFLRFLERVFLVDRDFHRAGTDLFEQILGGGDEIIALGDVVVERRPRRKERALGLQDIDVESVDLA